MKHVSIFTDGSCSGNPGPGGYAVIIEEGGIRRELTGGESQTTNNRMELRAVIEGLAALDEPSLVRVVTDSRYVANGMKSWIYTWRRKGWKTSAGTPVKNRDLWERLDKLSQTHEVSWEWVRGHNNHPENERADLLARQVAREFVSHSSA